jgi:hypothetical protein
MNYEDAFNTATIQLEPRLQEYSRRKKFNKINNIRPGITEEKEFGISPADIKILNQRGGMRHKKYNEDQNFVKPVKFQFTDYSEEFKKDPRSIRIQNKMNLHKKSREKIKQFEGISDDYTLLGGSNPYNTDNERHIEKPYNTNNEHIEKPHNNTFMLDSRDLVLNTSRPQERSKYVYSPNERSDTFNTYHHKSKLEYKQPNAFKNNTTRHMTLKNNIVKGNIEHSRQMTDIIGNMDTYNKHLNKTYEYVDNSFDTDTKTFIPGSNTETQRDTCMSYNSIPFGYGNGLPDISVENSLKGGYRDSSRRTIGFKNSFENQFQYISSDISDPKHTVQMWPQNSRGQNKEVASVKAVLNDNRLRNNMQ